VDDHKDKVEAIYDLRNAVEEKVGAKHALEREDTPETRDALLSATLKVEAKTQDAIEVCIHCGRAHAADEPHERRARVGDRIDNVVDVDFRQQSERDPEES
jgi:uncharacterized protein with PIN domain